MKSCLSCHHPCSDIASLDKFGYCKIEGRIKDMIIRGGENIYPAEIEQFLHTHPKVHEAQVIKQGTCFSFDPEFNICLKVAMHLCISIQVVGVKDERMGEEVCACIRLKADQECTAEEIRDYCKGKVRTTCARSVSDMCHLLAATGLLACSHGC